MKVREEIIIILNSNNDKMIKIRILNWKNNNNNKYVVS